MGFHLMKNAGVAPPWIELSGEIERRRDALERLLERAAAMARSGRAHLRRQVRDQYERQVVELRALVEDFNLLVPFVWLHRLPVSVPRELDRFEACWPGAEGTQTV
jgi:hypothetical protein